MKEIIAILGAGNMGEAIIRALVEGGIERDKIIVFDKKGERTSAVKARFRISIANSNSEAVKKADYIIIAVKPQDLKSVMEEIKSEVKDKTVISIAAGVKVERLREHLGREMKIVRVMPNICTLYAQSATGVFFSGNFSEDEKGRIKKLLGFFGAVIEVGEEPLLDVVTGLSGSGPAFVFVFLEAMTDAGVKLGLSRNDARALAIQTVLGSAKLAAESGKHFAELKDMVTSPGGTTMAGLKVLEDKKFRAAVMSAVESAVKRAKELAK